MIFGTDAIRAANVLYKEGGTGIQDWINKTNDAGYAAKTASDLTDNLSGDIERLKGSIETLAISSGSGANGGLRVLTKALDAMVGQFLNMPPAVGGTLTVLGGVGGASLIALAAFVKLRKGLAEAVLQLEAMGPAGEKAAVGLQKTAGAAGKAAVAFVALEASAAILNEFARKAADVDRLSDSLTNLANTGKVTGEAADKFGSDLHGIGDDAAIANSGVAKWLDKISGGIPIIGDAAHAAVAFGARLAGKDDYQTAVQNFANLDTALTQYMQTTGDARKSSELWNRVQSESGLSAEQLIKLLPNAYKEVGALNQAQMDAEKAGHGAANGQKAAADGAKQVAGSTPAATDATEKYTSSALSAAGAARGQRDALKSLSQFMKAETDPVFGLIKAEGDLKAAQDKASKAIKEHGKNSKEAKAATQDLALAAIGLQGAVGNVSQGFNGKLSPALVNTLKKAGVTNTEIKILTGQFGEAKKAADKYSGDYKAKASAPGAVDAKQKMADAWAAAKGFEGTYTAKLVISGNKTVDQKLADLLVKQRALASGLSLPSAAAAVQKDLDRNRQRGYSEGGWTGPGQKYEPAGVVHADEFVVNKGARGSLEDAKPGALDYMNRTGQWPGYALGGRVQWPFPTNVSKTKIPQPMFDAPGGAGGPGYKWMEAVVRAAFPGMAIYSDVRPGAITLTGNRSYHGLPDSHGHIGRAVDFAPSRPLAEWINLHFMRPTRELITPWQDLNIRNGARHHYSALVENQHNFAGGNAHDHWAMAHGGIIREPVFGVGASGDTYSFGEGYVPERVTSMGAGGGGDTIINVTVPLAAGANPVEHGRQIAQGLKSYLNAGGAVVLQNGSKVL
jgi:hypothetical protein